MFKRRGFKWLAGGLILTGALFLLGWIWPRPRLLMEQAQYITSAPEYDDYHWIDSQSLLLIRVQHRYEWKFSRLNLSTGRKTELIALNHLLKDSFVYHGQMELSPDVQSLLWTDEMSGGIRGARLDGTHYREWPGDWRKQRFHWMGESQHWITLESSGPDEPFKYFLMRSIEDRQEQTVPLPSNNILLGEYNVCLFTSEGRFLMDQTDQEGTNWKSVDLTEVALLPTYNRVRQIHVRPSIKGDIQEYALSSEGKQIAFIARYDYAPPYLVQLHHLLPFIKAPGQSVYGIWSGPVEGGAITEVGHINLHTNSDTDEGITELKWLPDGKRVSFAYLGRLYVVPVH